MLFQKPPKPYAKDTTRIVLDACLSKQDIVAEVGAYTGGATIFISNHARFVHAFEPNLEIFNSLKKNTAGLKNVKTYNLAISSSSGIGALNVFPGSSVSSLYRIDGHKYRGAVEVKTCRLDDISLDPVPNCLALDCEGAEVDVLKGAENLCKRSVDKTIVETHRLEGGKNTTSEVREVLSSLGFVNVIDLLKFSFQGAEKSWLHASRPS